MKKYIWSACCLLLLLSCRDMANYTSGISDVRIANPAGWVDLTGGCLAGLPVKAVSASLTLTHGYGRTVIVSAGEVNGIYIPETQFTLSEGFKPTVISVDVAGTAGEQTGTTELVLTIEGASDTPVEYTVYVTVDTPPAFGFMIKNSMVEINSQSWQSHYGYSTLQLPYDSAVEAFMLHVPYEYGFGRTMELDGYELWMIAKDGTETLLGPGDGWSLELMDGELAEGEEPDELLFRLNGVSATRFDIEVRKLRLVVHPTDPSEEDIILEESDDLHFPQIRVRAYDVLWKHNVGPNSPKLTIGYDILEVTSKLDGSVRRVFDQPLGYIRPVDTSGGPATWNPRPFLYQWGRGEDGHQVMYSARDGEFAGTTSVQSPGAIAPDSCFITRPTMPAAFNADWSTGDTYWSSESDGGAHNPCPTGYRLPTREEVGVNPGHRYFDGLDFHMRGNRSGQNGNFGSQATNAFYWSCSPRTDVGNPQAYCLQTANGTTWSANYNPRVNGMMIRCINIPELQE